jgi:flavodoxin
MKELVLYWTLGGSTKKFAERYASEHGVDAFGIKEKKKRGILGAWIPGVFQAARATASAIEDPGIDLDAYTGFVLAAPIWAGSPAPAINSVAQLIPPGKEVKIVLISGSGESNGAVKLVERLTAADVRVTSVENIKKSDI